LTETFAPADGLATVTSGDRHAPEIAWITADHALDFDENARNLTARL
jgi:hypothetical protein